MSTLRRMALLISGGVNRKLNHSRYRNDLKRWITELQAREFECAVCFADGLGISAAGARVRSARRSDIDDELSLLGGLSEDELAVVLVSNHGDAKGFCTWGTDRVTPTDLMSALSGCAATKVLILGQCYGGIFGSITLPDTVVIAGCGPNQTSWACASPPGAQAYDEFLFQFAEALFGPLPPNPGNPNVSEAHTSQSSNPGPAAVPAHAMTTAVQPVSLRAAFELAAAWDRRPETPTLADPAGLADTLVLG